MPLLKCPSPWIHSESSTLLHILKDVFYLSQVIFILKIFIDECTFGTESPHQSVFSRYTHLRHLGFYWGKKKPKQTSTIETKSKFIILPCCGISHTSVSVVWIVRAGENSDLFLVWWNPIYLYYFHKVLIILSVILHNGYVSASFFQKCFYSIGDFAFWELISDFWKHLFIDVKINLFYSYEIVILLKHPYNIIRKGSIKNKIIRCILMWRIQCEINLFEMWKTSMSIY